MATKTEEKPSAQMAGAKQQNTLEQLLHTGLMDILSAETQLVNALPEIAKAADSEELEEAVTTHLRQTEKHVERLKKIFERLQLNVSEGEKCKAMEGLIEEGKKIIREFDRGPVRDSALIIGAQKIEHYEIAAYGSLAELADVLGEGKIVDILEKTLEEEKDTDNNLTEIAQSINDEAVQVSV